MIHRAHRYQMLGGGMRQAGVIAAAGIYTLEHHVAGLNEDHRHICRHIAELPRGQVDLSRVMTLSCSMWTGMRLRFVRL